MSHSDSGPQGERIRSSPEGTEANAFQRKPEVACCSLVYQGNLLFLNSTASAYHAPVGYKRNDTVRLRRKTNYFP